MPLAGLISETLAPGIYLLPPNAADEAASALSAAGIDIISRRNEKAAALTDSSVAGSSLAAQLNRYFPHPVGEKINIFNNNEKNSVSAAENGTLPPSEAQSTPQSATVFATPSALTENFHAILKETPMGEPERAELSARIDRRLVLCETQLKEASLRYEKLEARNMDYAGKQNVAKQAIAQQSPVEIVKARRGKGRAHFWRSKSA